MIDKVKYKLDEYEGVFGENLPLMEIPDTSDEAIIQLVDECIRKREPYTIDYGEDLY